MADDNIPLDPRLSVTGNQSGATPADPVTFRDLSPYLNRQGATQPAQRSSLPGHPQLRAVRSVLGQELQDPQVRQRLIASTMAEVGDQGREARIAYLESVMNRSVARGNSLWDTISNPHYYPKSTTSKLDRTYSQSTQDQLNDEINEVLGGSNLSGFATGNESGRVRSGGAQITFNPGTGERFVLENPDVGWTRNLATEGKLAQQESPPPTSTVGGQTWQDLSPYLTQPST